ncbi:MULTISPECIES: hypothetical protein [unclassified Helicobacter]|uniref:hypothetical protein n=1 Tax=unclassified Helicobacter TaxID=2593540 RepID=UPI00115F9AD7|nr:MULTISPECIES: hypothetical protein [unclassified Helicobacter]
MQGFAKFWCGAVRFCLVLFLCEMSAVLGFRNGAESARITKVQNLRESRTQKLRESRFCLFGYFLDSTKPTNRATLANHAAFVTCARI